MSERAPRRYTSELKAALVRQHVVDKILGPGVPMPFARKPSAPAGAEGVKGGVSRRAQRAFPLTCSRTRRYPPHGDGDAGVTDE